METATLNIHEVMASRISAIEASLHRISPESLKAVCDELFPDTAHPGREIFLNIVGDLESAPFYHAMTDDRTHLIYAHGARRGMWFAHQCGTGPLQAEPLELMNDIVKRRT
jgi:hypothetical protein